MSHATRSKRIAPVAVLALASLPAAAGFNEGMECYKTKNWDCVISEFKTETDAHQDYDYGWFMIGVGHLQKKEYDQAVSNLRKAIEINDQKLSYHLALSNAHFGREQYDKVIQTLQGKDNLSGTAGEAYNLSYQLGTSYHQTKQHERAIPYLEKAVAVKPDFKTFFMLGVSYDAIGSPDKAIATLKEALKQNPNDAQVLSVLADAYVGMAQREANKAKKEQYYTEAVSYAAKAAAAKPKDYQAQNTLARAYLGADQYDQAEAAFKKVLALKPDYCFAQINLGMVYIGKKQWHDAVKVLTDGTSCDPRNNVGWESLGFAQEKVYKELDTELAKIAQLQKALASFEKANAIKPSASAQASIDRVKQNIDIANQNLRIAAGNLRTMEANLASLKQGLLDAQNALAQAEKQRQFFRDKGSWTDAQEQDFLKEKAVIEKDIASYQDRIQKQEQDIASAKASAQPPGQSR
jgi:tetratricopeptide (TPR) repeat protein